MERLRDDPYYIFDDRPPVNSIDAIPIERLDDLPIPLPQGSILPTTICPQF